MTASPAPRGAELLERLAALPFLERDGWVDRLLGFAPPPPDLNLPPGAVPYLPCGVEEIVAMVREVPLRPEDELVDLGSGLGRVAIVAHLLSGARACGVELQPQLVALARARCEALGLKSVSFVQANAAETLVDGSVFFIYSSFNGELLARVLQRVEEVARRRSIVVCAVDFELRQPWLEARPPSRASLTIYDSV